MPSRQQHGLNRRQILRHAGGGLLGLNLGGLLAARSALGTASDAVIGTSKIRSCIVIFYYGGPSHLDTFDMKPDAPAGIRGPYHPIATSVPGTQLSNMLPRLARLADRYTILRSASHPLSGHNSSAAYVLSGHSPGGDSRIQPTAMDHPTYGSVVSRIMPAPTHLPSSVSMDTLSPLCTV